MIPDDQRAVREGLLQVDSDPHPAEIDLAVLEGEARMRKSWQLCTYAVRWSEEDQEYVGLCAEYPSLSWLDPAPEAAWMGIRKLVEEVVADLQGGDPTPRSYAGHLRWMAAELAGIAERMRDDERNHREEVFDELPQIARRLSELADKEFVEDVAADSA